MRAASSSRLSWITTVENITEDIRSLIQNHELEGTLKTEPVRTIDARRANLHGPSARVGGSKRTPATVPVKAD